MNFITNTYGAEFLFTDTDSLVYQIKTKDFYVDFHEDIT